MIKLKKVGKIIGVIFLIVLILLIISTIIHQVLKKVDKEKYSIYGEYIEVNGKNMYISVLGDGEKTIVILSHSLESIKKICTRGIWIKDGKVEYDGNIKKAVEEYLKVCG